MPGPVDEQAVQSERRHRRRRWVAEHGGVITVVSALFFGAMGARFGSGEDTDVGWLNPVVTGAVGVVFGAFVGYFLSAEARDTKVTGKRRVLFIVGMVFCIGVVVGVRYLNDWT